MDGNAPFGRVGGSHWLRYRLHSHGAQMLPAEQPVVVTSISPALSRGRPSSSDAGLAYQSRCVQSWLNAGARVISVNNRVEVAMLDVDHPGVEFVQSAARRGGDNPKGLPDVSEMLKVGCDLPAGTVFALTNSDVEFRGDAEVLNSLFQTAKGGCAFANRYEWLPHSAEPGLPYRYGYDFFIMENSLVAPSELAGFRIGSPWWDYLFLYLVAAREIPLTLIDSPVISHSTHDQAWNIESWTRGLRLIARRIRELCEEEGPAAALLGYVCRSLEEGTTPGFAIESIMQELGTIIGTAMVGYISAACRKALWFECVVVEGSNLPRGSGRIVRHLDNLSHADA